MNVRKVLPFGGVARRDDPLSTRVIRNIVYFVVFFALAFGVVSVLDKAYGATPSTQCQISCHYTTAHRRTLAHEATVRYRDGKLGHTNMSKAWQRFDHPVKMRRKVSDAIRFYMAVHRPPSGTARGSVRAATWAHSYRWYTARIVSDESCFGNPLVSPFTATGWCKIADWSHRAVHAIFGGNGGKATVTAFICGGGIVASINADGPLAPVLWGAAGCTWGWLVGVS